MASKVAAPTSSLITELMFFLETPEIVEHDNLDSLSFGEPALAAALRRKKLAR
jgi:hypothetical protein